MRLLDGSSAGPGPWFTARPRLTVVVVVALFAAVCAARLLVSRSHDPITLFFALPIALAATAFGLRGGVISGLAAVGLLVVWGVGWQADLSPVGWIAQALPLLLLGGLLGDAADRATRAEATRHELELAAERRREAAEINDTLIQGMTAAKWAIEAGDRDTGLATLNDTLGMGQRLVSELLRDSSVDRADVMRSKPRQNES